MDLNKVMIIGRLTRDPELRATSTGQNVCQMSIATSYTYTNKTTGQKVETPEYHNIVIWGKLGDIAAQYLKKGRKVYIEGRLVTRTWDGQDGQKKNRTEIIASDMIMLESMTNSAQAPTSFNAASTPNKAEDIKFDLPSEEELPTIEQEEVINVEDIPF